MNIKNLPHDTEDGIPVGVMGINLGVVDAPHFEALHHKCISGEPIGVMVIISEEAGMSEQIPNTQLPHVKFHQQGAGVNTWLHDMALPGGQQRILSIYWESLTWVLDILEVSGNHPLFLFTPGIVPIHLMGCLPRLFFFCPHSLDIQTHTALPSGFFGLIFT